MAHTSTLPTPDEQADLSIRHERLVGQISSLNPTAHVEWLGRFDDADLRDYLSRLSHLVGRRGRDSRWERRRPVPAAVAAVPADN